MQPVLITTTVPNLQEGKSIAKALIKERAAGCVNIIGPLISIYEWKNKIEEDNEYKILIKSKEENWSEIVRLIENIHSYSIPEISMIRIDRMHIPYRKWLAEIINP